LERASDKKHLKDWDQMIKNRRMLVILAHPDDESFPMGGTLAKYAADYVRVTLACATRGEAGIANLSPERAGLIREGELRCAIDILGLDEVRFLDYRDGTLAQANSEELITRLADILHEMRPDAVLTFGPDGISGHPDHVTLSTRVTQAFERAALPDARLYYIAPSEATLQGCGVTPSREVAGGPVAGIDITDYRLPKVRAIQCHASQNPPFQGNPEEQIENLACHEYFILARPSGKFADTEDLFAPLQKLP
jgi:LmbE family N-acetylglucosaminyl deacetylase